MSAFSSFSIQMDTLTGVKKVTRKKDETHPGTFSTAHPITYEGLSCVSRSKAKAVNRPRACTQCTPLWLNRYHQP